jgi:hypothetical protein
MSDNTTAVVIASVGVAAGIRLSVDLKEQGRGPQHFPTMFGAFLLCAALLLIGEFLPAIARGLALVILLTAAVMSGGKFFALISSLVDKPKPTGKGTLRTGLGVNT